MSEIDCHHDARHYNTCLPFSPHNKDGVKITFDKYIYIYDLSVNFYLLFSTITHSKEIMNEESVVSAKDSEKQVLRQQLRSSVGADDPFYPRQGKSLTWKNVNMTVVSFF